MKSRETYLYIYTITTEGGIRGIERLREALAGAPALRAKAFNRPNDDKTFFIHAEADISDLLTSGGFPFTCEKLLIGEEFSL